MSILVDNKPITEYSHEGMTFVWARNGTEYKIRVRNNSYRRACFVLSVDGLSVIDGKDAGDASPGYVLNPHQTLDIACYKVDDGTGAKFVFGTKEHSYSAEIGKGTDNTGVIAVKVFHEKYQPPQPYFRPVAVAACAGMPPKPTKSSSMRHGLHQRSIGGSGWGEASFSTQTAGGWENIPHNSTESMSDERARGITRSAPEPEEGLGTVFGESMEWKTHTVDFEREITASAQMVIYYDTKKGLERRGVKLEHKAPPLPNPFPGDNAGCVTPPGWKR